MTIRVRKQSATGDFVFGYSLGDYYIDIPEAVAQVVKTRLGLNLGEWFLDTTDGTNWATGVLGPRTINTRDPIIRARILGTPGVIGLVSYSSQAPQDGSRQFAVQTTVATQFGPTTTQFNFLPTPTGFAIGTGVIGIGAIA